MVLVLFAFALDPDRGLLEKATPGLYWIAVLFSGLLAMQRSFAVEAADGVTDALRLSGLAPAGIYLGKTLSVAVQLLVLERGGDGEQARVQRRQHHVALREKSAGSLRV